MPIDAKLLCCTIGLAERNYCIAWRTSPHRSSKFRAESDRSDTKGFHWRIVNLSGKMSSKSSVFTSASASSNITPKTYGILVQRLRMVMNIPGLMHVGNHSYRGLISGGRDEW
jgi:hypothetical protein